MMKKRAYLHAVVAVAVAAVIMVSYTLFGQGSPQLGQGSQAQEIVPANVPTSKLCPLLFKGQVVSSVKYSSAANIGIYNLTHNQTNNFQDFVIAPGRVGTITYKVNVMTVGMPNKSVIPQNVTVTNNFLLSHSSHRVVKENVTQVNSTLTRYSNGTFVAPGMGGVLASGQLWSGVLSPGQISHIWGDKGTTIIFPNGTKITLANDTYFIVPNDFPIGVTTVIGYRACYPGVCYGSSVRPPEFLNISFDNYSHPTINVSFRPSSESISAGKAAYINLTISATSNALPGTYLLSVFTTNEVCEGPFAYLTIGTVPYSGNALSIGII